MKRPAPRERRRPGVSAYQGMSSFKVSAVLFLGAAVCFVAAFGSFSRMPPTRYPPNLTLGSTNRIT